MEDEEAQRILRKEERETEDVNRDKETWYHKGPSSLRDARIAIAKFSLPRSLQSPPLLSLAPSDSSDERYRAQWRLDKAREDKTKLSGTERARRLQEIHKWVRALTIYGSQIGDARPLSYCEFSPDSSMIATASWFTTPGSC